MQHPPCSLTNLFQANPDTDLEPKWKDYIVPVLQYLKDKENDVHSVIANVGGQIQTEVAPDKANKIAYYFDRYATTQYSRAINYLAEQQAKLIGQAVHDGLGLP